MEIKILSGSASIGGNFVRIEDGDRTVIFDQGIRFDIMRKYYSGFVSPRGVAELRGIGAIPRPEWYEGADAIYISHMHLDHLGALSNIPHEVKVVKLPSMAVYEQMEERWSKSPTWLQLVPRKYYLELEELRPLQADENDVVAVPVSHSAHPAYAFIYFGRDGAVLYTGDFRVESFLEQSTFRDLNGGDDLLTFLEENRDLRIDTLIIEGTNIGSDRLPVSPAEAVGIVRKLVGGRAQVLATLHSLDVEYAYTMALVASDAGMRVAVASAPLAWLLERVPRPPPMLQAVEEYVDYPTSLPRTSVEEIEDKTLILVSYREIIDLARDLSSAGGLSGDCLALISEPEPQVEEGSEYAAVASWFSLLGVEAYRLRVSGHYYQYQLKAILGKIRPKEVVPIHTEKPELLRALGRRWGFAC